MTTQTVSSSVALPTSPSDVADLATLDVWSATRPSAAGLLRLSRDASYQAAGRGEIPTVRVGRRLLVPTARLLAMLNGGADR